MSSWDEGPDTQRRHVRSRRGRAAALVALLAAGLTLGPAVASADQGAPSEPQAAQIHRVSPYARVIREHAQSADKKPARVKPSSFSVGHAPRVGVRARR
jgi:hypothetical protein